MKKMVMMLVALSLVTLGANAGQVAWSVNGVKSHDPLTGALDGTTTLNNGTALAGAVCYLFLGTLDASGIASAIQDGTFLTAASVASATTTTAGITGSQYYGTYTTEAITAYVVVFDAGGYTADGQGNYWISSAITKTFTGSLNQTYTFLMNSTTTSWTHYNNVPEPTSMALLAIGVAAVGLRRKFRK